MYTYSMDPLYPYIEVGLLPKLTHIMYTYSMDPSYPYIETFATVERPIHYVYIQYGPIVPIH